MPADYASGVETTLTMEYWDGDLEAWTAFALGVEDTKAFMRSGFIKWEPLIQEGTTADWGLKDVNGSSLYWVRLKVADTITAATRVNGINIVFADDNDLKREEFGILEYLPKDSAGVRASTFILAHVAARETILQRLRNSGKIKVVPSGTPEDLDEWDLFRSQQIRQAAVFGALAKIYFQASDSQEDIYWIKYKEYTSQLAAALNLFLLSYDQDDDGLESAAEKATAASEGRFHRR